MNKNLTIYFDMDGVVADFDKDCKALRHLDEMPWLNIPKFFRNLEVIGNPDSTIKLLQDLGYTVYILTKVEVRDTQERAMDKLEWVKENIPSLPIENVIIVPIHHNKTDYIKSDISKSILVDDYKGNLREWKDLGGIAVKFGNKWKTERPYFQIVSDIFQIVGLAESLEKIS